MRAPVFKRRIDPGQTGWFASPSLVDLNRDGKLEIVAPMYSTYVFSPSGRRLATGTASAGRVYAPSVVADLDGDGTKEIVVGGTGAVVAYDWRGAAARGQARLAGVREERGADAGGAGARGG